MLSKIDKSIQKFWLIGFGLFLVFFVALRLSYLSTLETQPDCGLFESFGYFLLQGKHLYTDIFDHKPPGIYWINKGLLWVFGLNENSIIFGVFGAVVIAGFFVGLSIFNLLKSKIWGFIGGTFFIVLITQPKILGSGNYSELFGVVFLVIGFYFSTKKSVKHSNILISNVFLGCTILLKEPFAISIIPIFIYNFNTLKTNFKQKIIVSTSLVWPLVLATFVLIISGQLLGFIMNEKYSFGYSQKDTSWGILGNLASNFTFYFKSLGIKTWITIFILLISFNGLVRLKQLHGSLKWLLITWLLADYLAVNFPGNQFEHYLIQTIPSISIFIIIGLSFYFNNLFNKYNIIKSLTITLIFYIFIIQTYDVNKNVSFHFTKSPETLAKDSIVNFFKKETNKPIDCQIISKYLGSYCLKLQTKSSLYFPIPYPYMWYIPKSMKTDFLNRINKDISTIRKSPPNYILGDEELCEMYTDFGLKPFFDSNYVNVLCYNRDDGKQLWLKKRK